MKEEVVRHTVYLPMSLLMQLQARATINRRSVSKEIVVLIEDGIDYSVKADLAVIEAQRRGLLGK
jgi:hypothetical protein